MGDRANIILREPNAPDLYVYTHWSGSKWPERARAALAGGRGRWGDPQYLNRIIVREVFAELDGDTGGGLSTRIGDKLLPAARHRPRVRTQRNRLPGRGGRHQPAGRQDVHVRGVREPAPRDLGRSRLPGLLRG